MHVSWTKHWLLVDTARTTIVIRQIKREGGGKRCTNKKRFVLNGFQRFIAAGLSQQCIHSVTIILYFRIRIHCLCIISYYNKQIQLFFSHFSNIFSLWGYIYPGIGYWIRCNQEQSTAQNFFCIQTELLFGK